MKNNLLITPCSSASDIRRNDPKYKFSTFNFSKIEIESNVQNVKFWGFKKESENLKNLVIKCNIEYIENHKFKGESTGKTYIEFSYFFDNKMNQNTDFKKLYSDCIKNCADYLKIDLKTININEFIYPLISNMTTCLYI